MNNNNNNNNNNIKYRTSKNLIWSRNCTSILLLMHVNSKIGLARLNKYIYGHRKCENTKHTLNTFLKVIWQINTLKSIFNLGLIYIVKVLSGKDQIRRT